MRKLMLIGTGLLLLSGVAQAADNGIYIGAAIGQANVEIDDVVAQDDFKGDDLGYKIIVGIRPLDWLGVEASYVNFGKPEDTVANSKIRTEGSGFSGFAVGFLSLGPIDAFAKAGLVSWDAEVSNLDTDGTDFAYGVGFQFRVLSVSVRAEYEVFDIDDVDDANMISVGLTYTFL
ncbi:MAG TPA: outer membrane beta-barrel protein [Steroidobacteraceae bacterium]|jgi:opacity protein-like surface antigen